MNNPNPVSKQTRPLVTITPYNEQGKRVINGNAHATIAQPPPAPPLPLPSKSKNNNEDSVEMQSIESFKLKDTPNPIVPKPPSTYFSMNNAQTISNSNESPRHVVMVGNKSQPQQQLQLEQINGSRDQSPSTEENSKTRTSPSKFKVVGKVAIRIGTYEGETKQPSKLDFLSQQSRLTNCVDGKNGIEEEIGNGPVVSRLQNELAATLQRSNLRKKTDTESQSSITTNEDSLNSEPGKLPQSSLDKLASALGNKVTIKMNPENEN